jgi:hypothetical protein
MAVPSVMADLSTTANSNSPAGTESPSNADDFLRAIQAIVRTTNAKGADIASATTTDIGAATGEFVDVTGTTTITGLGTVAAGIVRTVRFTGALTLTHNATSLILPGGANITTAANDRAVFRSLGSGNWLCVAYVKASGAPITLGISTLSEVAPLLDDYAVITDSSDSNNPKRSQLSDILGLLRGYIDGLVMSTAGSSATISIAAGVAADSTNTELISLSSAIAKTTSAWAVGTGNGGLDTGSIANDTWYHFYLIRRPDTGVVDVVFSTSASSPTLPANYTQYRRIGAGRTNGSAQWTRFFQNGDEFLWETPTLDFNATNPGTSAVSRTLRVPTGIVVYAISNWMVLNTAAAVNFSGVVSSLDTTDSAPNISAAPLINLGGNVATAAGNVAYASAYLTIKTNTSGQVRSRMLGSDANCNLRASTVGWIDTRGRDA